MRVALLFNLIVHTAASNVKVTGNIIYKSTQIGAYADYTVIMGHSENAVKETFNDLEKKLMKVGLKINQDKTKYT